MADIESFFLYSVYSGYLFASTERKNKPIDKAEVITYWDRSQSMKMNIDTAIEALDKPSEELTEYPEFEVYDVEIEK